MTPICPLAAILLYLRMKGTEMRIFNGTFCVLAVGLAAATWAAGQTKLPFDTYSGYFVSNKFEPDAAASFVVIDDQTKFDQVLGLAMVMRDKSHRLPRDAFKSSMVLAAIKRGNALWEYKVEGVTVEQGVVQLRYAVTSKATPDTTFACPLIVSIPRGDYKAVVFIEDGRKVETVKVGPKGQSPKEEP